MGGCASKLDEMTKLIVTPQASAEQVKARQEQLAKTREQYVFDYSKNWLPPHFKGLPKIEMDADGADQLLDLFVDLQGKAAKMKFNEKIDLFLDKFRTEAPFEDYFEIYPHEMTFCGIKRNVPTVSKRWRDDKEFGRQRLCGFDPLSIRLYEGPIAKFPVTDAILGGLLGAGKTLESETKAKKLYYVDLEVLEGTPAPAEVTWVVPIALFHVNDKGDLMPVAIQLQQDPSKSLIFTPNDPPGCWLAVKSFFQQANGVLHENVLHLLSTHMISEVFYVAARRQLAELHPVHELIRAHFWFTLIINFSARNSLMVPGGQLPSLFAQGLEGMQYLCKKFNDNWDFNTYVVPEDIKARKVDDVNALPNYFYRDDSLRVWAALEAYVTDLINNFYASDDEVKRDTELQAWIKECQVGVTWKNLPVSAAGTFETRAQLIRMLTIIIYTVSARHAAVNNGQFELMGFVPNMPPIFKMPQPTTKADITDEVIAKAMPNYAASIVQVSFFHAVSLPTDDDKALGRYDKKFLTARPKALPFVAKFLKQLNDLSKAIEERNSKLEVPYTYLDPKQIAGGVAI